MTNNSFKQTEIGEIPDIWNLSSIGELVNVKGRIGWRGYTKDDLKTSGPLVLGGTNITNNKIDLSKPTYLSEEKYKESPEIMVKTQDIIVTKTGNSIGDVAIVLEDLGKATINPNVALFKVDKEKINPRFLFFYLLTKEAQSFLKNSSSSSAQPAINQTTLKQMKVVLPHLDEQQQIASVLSSLDDKIELNRRMNRTLEEIGKALFKRWFVDFEFPDKNGEPYKSSGGEMKESELGEIPKGWKVDRLNKLIEIRGGFSYKSEHLVDEGTPLVNMGCTSPETRFNYEGLKFYSVDVHARYTLKSGDLVLPTRDVTQERKILGSPIIIPNNIGEKIICATNLYKVKNLGVIPNEYLYQLFRESSFRNRMVGSAKGTTILMLTKDSVLGFETVIPDSYIVENYIDIVNPIVSLVNQNTSQIQSLEIVRDSLLPRLMNGKLRVNNLYAEISNN